MTAPFLHLPQMPYSLYFLKPTSNKRNKVAKKNERSKSTSEAMLRNHQAPASFFYRKAQVLFGALKTKSCLSVSEFFLFSGENHRSR